jgi:hypothetical protein
VTPDNELVTRQTDNGILAGITRGTLKKIANDLQLKFVERPFSLAEAKKAKEAFITSATSFVTPVVKIDGEKVRRRQGRPTARGCERNMSALRPRVRPSREPAGRPSSGPRPSCSTGTNTLVEHLADHHRVLLTPLSRALGQALWTRKRSVIARTARCVTISRSCFGERAGEAETVFFDTIHRIHLERLEPLPGADVLLARAASLGCYVAVVSNKVARNLRIRSRPSRLGRWITQGGRRQGCPA